MHRPSPLELDLWKAWQGFRPAEGGAEHRNYFIALLFLKFLSDRLRARLAQCRQEFDGDEARIERRMRREPFQLPLGTDFEAVHEQRDRANLGELINAALEKVAEANQGKLEGVFRHIDFNSEALLGSLHERNRRLKGLLEDLAPLSTGESDAFAHLIQAFAEEAGKRGAEFCTPPEIVTLLARLLAPRKGDRICDPACGSGGLLLGLAREIGDRDFALYGQEADRNTWALCRLNLFLQNIDNARIERGDCLQNPKLVDGDALRRFEIVVCNPLFSLDEWQPEAARKDRYHRFSRGIPPRTKADYAFVSQMVETTAADRGKVGVVLSAGALFRGGTEAKIRQRLVEENLLDCVIGLPANLFYATGIPAVICLFRQGKTHSDVLFIDASREMEETRDGARLRPQDLDRIAAAYRQYESIANYACRATQRQIEKNDFNLSLSRYIAPIIDPEEPEPRELRAEIERLEADLAHVREEIDRGLRMQGEAPR